jgi:outer membrane lipoprotein SlyB
MKKIITLVTAACLLSACQQPGMNRYGYQDVGHAAVVEFGTVIASRAVEITGQNSGVGATAGALGGGIAGSTIGHGAGSLGAMLAGALIAGVAGNMAEQAISDHYGVEYTITTKHGQTVTIVQNVVEGEPHIHVGDRVMIQQSGMYMRVLPASDMPTKIKRPKDIRVVD